MNKKIFWACGIGILLGVIGLLAWQSGLQSAGATADQAATVTPEVLSAQVSATGTIRAAQSAALVWQTSGRVGRVNVKIGDKVSADTVLAALEQSSLPREILLARVELVAAQQALDTLTQSNLRVTQAMLTLSDARQEVDDAQEKLDFYEGLAQGRGSEELLAGFRDKIKTSQEQLKFIEWMDNKFYKNTGADSRRKAEINLVLAGDRQNLAALLAQYNWFTGKPSESLLAEIRAVLNLAKAHQEDAQRELDRLADSTNDDDLNAARARLTAAQATLNLSEIIAPFNGTVTQALAQTDDRITPGILAFKLDDLSHLLIDLQIPETDINRVAVGQAVTVTVDAIPGKSYPASVTSVDLSGHKERNEVCFTVTVALTDTGELLKPGMTAVVVITAPAK